MTELYRLGVDFGTSNTAAVLRFPDGNVKPLVIDGSELVPSAVCLDEAGQLLAGRDAVYAGRVRPEAFEPHPKRCIDDGETQHGDTPVPVAAAMGAVLGRVAAEATRIAGGAPGSVTLTCPASWGPRRRDTVRAGAARAGLADPHLMAEPEAGAMSFTAVAGRELPIGGALVVYDFGAGTFDASVVRRTGDGFEVAATRGLAETGGLDIDAALTAYLGTVYGARDPHGWARLTAPSTGEDRRAALQLWDDVRVAKERLSRSGTATVHVPLFNDDAPIGREQLEQLAGPILERTVRSTRAAVRAAGLRPDEVTGVFLVGGSSRIPLVATLLHQAFGLAPTTIERPELVVAEGSVRPAWPAGAPPAPCVSTEAPPTPGASTEAGSSTGPSTGAGTTAPRRPTPGPVRPPRRRRGRRWIAGLVAAGVAVVIGVTQCDRPGGPGPVAQDNCVEFNLVSSDEKVPALTEIARRYRTSGHGVDGRCVRANISTYSSRLMADLLADAAGRGWDSDAHGPRPDAWTPSSSIWTERLRTRVAGQPGQVTIPADLASVTRTPVVIALPEPMARALGWPRAEIGWADLAGLVGDPAGWAAKGHPEWGEVTVGKTNPNTSTTGLHALLATVSAAAGGAPLTPETMHRPQVVDLTRAIETAAVHYGTSVAPFLHNLYEADRQGGGTDYVSAIALEEQVVWQYNRGHVLGMDGQQPPPGTRLVAVYPKEGTMASDNPYAVLRAPWSEPVKQRAAEAFLDFVHEPAQKKLFLDNGFRDEEDRAGGALKRDDAFSATAGYRQLPAPGASIVDAALQLWNEVRKPASVLMAVDVSGSMNQRVAGTAKTRLQLAKEAAVTIPDRLAPTDELGLWAFGSTPGADPWRTLVRRGPVSSTAEAYRAAVQGLSPRGGTPLYAVTRAAAESMRPTTGTGRIHAVIVLSDGANEYQPDTDLDRLLADLARTTDDPVPVFTIAYGTDADRATLDRIARASRGEAYDATNATTLTQIVSDVLANF
ncbi:hypothetical protein GCM10009558_072980 [Virgisporangium aurantiacum]